MRYTYRYRSFFWPALLILAGIVALLANTGAITVDRLFQLALLWPLILVVLGLELIVRRTLHGTGGDLAAALIVLVALVGAVGFVIVSPNPGATHTLDVSGPIGNLEQGAVEVNVGAATLNTSSSAELGSDAYHAHIEYSGPAPRVSFDQATGRLTISQNGGGNFFYEGRKFTLTLELNSGIPWTMTENSGASTDTIDVPDLHLGSLTINTGASREEITLGPPSGAVPVSVNGGALTVHVHRPTGAKASVYVSGGVVSLDADGQSFHAIGTAGYQTGDLGADYYKIEVNGGACTVTLDMSSPAQ